MDGAVAQVSAAARRAGRRGDWYLWAKEIGLYIDQDELVALLKDESERLLVVDTRDDDVGGGHVRGALHCPDGTFLHGGLDKVLSCVKERAGATDKPVTVVLHCMESARRGPRCARWLAEAVHAEEALDSPREWHRSELSAPAATVADSDAGGAGGAGATSCSTSIRTVPRIRVLRGGADQWIRRFWKDDRLVEGFDAEYWGWGGTSADASDMDSGELDGAAAHVDYSRPRDQPATEWSEAGADVVDRPGDSETERAQLQRREHVLASTTS